MIHAKLLSAEKMKISVMSSGVPDRVAAARSATAKRPMAISAIVKGTLKRSQKMKVTPTVNRPGSMSEE